MALKRSFCIRNATQHAKCLECGQEIPRELLESDTLYTCPHCNTKQFIDVRRQGREISLTRAEYSGYRPTPTDEAPKDETIANLKLLIEDKDEQIRCLCSRIENLLSQLEIKSTDCNQWKKAAEELAMYIENRR